MLTKTQAVLVCVNVTLALIIVSFHVVSTLESLRVFLEERFKEVLEHFPVYSELEEGSYIGTAMKTKVVEHLRKRIGPWVTDWYSDDSPRNGTLKIDEARRNLS